MKKKLIIFMPSIEGGGVEKNLFLVSNYLCKKLNNVTLITISKKYKKKFNKSIKFRTSSPIFIEEPLTCREIKFSPSTSSEEYSNIGSPNFKRDSMLFLASFL